jgi:hypothetical protein
MQRIVYIGLDLRELNGELAAGPAKPSEIALEVEDGLPCRPPAGGESRGDRSMVALDIEKLGTRHEDAAAGAEAIE